MYFPVGLALYLASGSEVDPALVWDAGKWIAGVAAAFFTTWVLMQKRVKDLETWQKEQETAAREERAERERQQAAWWERIGEIKTAQAELDRACSNATVELRTKIAGLEHRVDTHSQSNVANLAGIVRNYNDMLVQTLDTLKEALRQAAKGA